ncbi:Histone-lysine N-methyltransferase ASHR1 [Halotydeus destructor]|nr:Histone-lysine N-methyltransferase ASHR1 [Halotydeus destructor]
MVVYCPGDIIASCLPFVAVVSDTEKKKRCDACFQRISKPNKCPNCRQMYYCSSQCRRKDWKKGHWDICRVLSQRFDGGSKRIKLWPESLRLLLQYTMKCVHRNNEALKQNFELYDGRKRKLTDLMDHLEHFDSNALIGKNAQLYQMIQALNSAKFEITHAQLLKFFGQLSVNSFGIKNETDDILIGIGLYVEISIFDHSCQPNAAIVFTGKTLTLRALTDIDTAREEITVSYVPLTYDCETRQTFLRQNYFFTCTCPLCNEPEDFDYWHLKKVEEFIRKVKLDESNDQSYLLCTWYHEYIDLLKRRIGMHHPLITITLWKYIQERECVTNQVWSQMLFEITGTDLVDLKDELSKMVIITHGSNFPLFSSRRHLG